MREERRRVDMRGLAALYDPEEGEFARKLFERSPHEAEILHTFKALLDARIVGEPTPEDAAHGDEVVLFAGRPVELTAGQMARARARIQARRA